MPCNPTLKALIAAVSILAHVPAASAVGWDMSWFTFGYSAGGIVLNGTSLGGVDPSSNLRATVRRFQITVAKPPAAPAPLVPIPYPNAK